MSATDYAKQLDEARLNVALGQYLAEFDSHWVNELYKWEAVQCFQRNWDIDAPNFVDMLDMALSKTNNLLASMNSFPYGMLINFAKAEPEGVRQMFKTLFDEDIDLNQRFNSFLAESKRLQTTYNDGSWNNHYQNTNAVSTYLWLRFPDKYYIYKYGEYNEVGKKISNGVRFVRNGSPEEMSKGLAFYGAITSYLAKSPDFVNLFKKKLSANIALYPDPKLHTATIDFCFWVSRYFTVESSEVSIEEDKSKANPNPKYWWLVANPKIWSMAELPVGGTVAYSLYNDNGKQRRVFQNLLDAKVGDLVIGYESTPRKQIVALAEVSRANDGKTIEFTKTESLQAPIDYAEIKGIEELSHMQFFGNAQGSFFALTEDEYDCLYDIIRSSNPKYEQVKSAGYTKDDFLSEVYLTSSEYDRLVKLIEAKKNIILQGAPGVGKTFAAKRLAYSIMGTKDDSCVEMVQFHQNYTYEDFIMGFKPNEDGGFSLEKGKFYNFCNVAKAYPEKKFFFIIDEINRGNLSKIFGELLMLIENNYRGNEHKIDLAYSREAFYVPKNLYIIGMMNTADRSLAMIDYALRRRFSFYEMMPGFDADGFKAYQSQLNSEIFDNFIGAIKQLNEVIAKDDSLGTGFCIGHSYFCNQETFDKQWLENVLEFDIAPMLKEYWFDDAQKYENQVTRLRAILK
jgi:5-methylcytosine-specific restriction protein B